MAPSHTYNSQVCSLARALEVVGERWTLLIIRDSFYGVRRFTDFATHLEIPRAILSERLAALVGNGVLERVPGAGGHGEYALTAKGQALWPVVFALSMWGKEYQASGGTPRTYRHAPCGTEIDAVGSCSVCGVVAAVADIVMAPGPGLGAQRDEPVSRALARPHRLLEPLATSGA